MTEECRLRLVNKEKADWSSRVPGLFATFWPSKSWYSTTTKQTQDNSTKVKSGRAFMEYDSTLLGSFSPPLAPLSLKRGVILFISRVILNKNLQQACLKPKRDTVYTGIDKTAYTEQDDACHAYNELDTYVGVALERFHWVLVGFHVHGFYYQ